MLKMSGVQHFLRDMEKVFCDLFTPQRYIGIITAVSWSFLQS